MNSILKKAGLLVALVTFATGSALLAAEEEKKGGGEKVVMSVKSAFATNYVFRGSPPAQADSAFGFAPTWQPSVTTKFGDGISTTFWANLYMLDRNEPDDHSGIKIRKADEVDMSLDITEGTSFGEISGGIIAYFYPAASRAGGIPESEIYMGLHPKVLKVLGMGYTVYADMNSGAFYNQLDVVNREFGPIEVGLSVGMDWGSNPQGGDNQTRFRDVTLGIGFDKNITKNSAFFISANGSYLFDAELLNGPGASDIVSWVDFGAKYSFKGKR